MVARFAQDMRYALAGLWSYRLLISALERCATRGPLTAKAVLVPAHDGRTNASVLRLLLQNPGANLFERDWGHSFFDLRVLGRRACLGCLEQVIEAGEFVDFEVLVACLF